MNYKTHSLVSDSFKKNETIIHDDSDTFLNQQSKDLLNNCLTSYQAQNYEETLSLLNEITLLLKNEVPIIQMNHLSSNQLLSFAESTHMIEIFVSGLNNVPDNIFFLVIQFCEAFAEHGKEFQKLSSNHYYEFCQVFPRIIVNNPSLFIIKYLNFLSLLSPYHVLEVKYLQSLQIIQEGLVKIHSEPLLARFLCKIFDDEKSEEALHFLISSLSVPFPENLEYFMDYIKLGIRILKEESQPPDNCIAYIINVREALLTKFSNTPDSFQILGVEFATLINLNPKLDESLLILPPLELISSLFDSASEEETIISMNFIKTIIPRYYDDLKKAISIDLIWATIEDGIQSGSLKMKIASIDFFTSMFELEDPEFLFLSSDCDFDELCINFLDSNDHQLQISFFRLINTIVKLEVPKSGSNSIFLKHIWESSINHFLGEYGNNDDNEENDEIFGQEKEAFLMSTRQIQDLFSDSSQK